MAGRYPRRVRVASQVGTALRESTPADEDEFGGFLEDRSGRRLSPRSVVRWDAGVTTSTADSVLAEELS